VLRRTLDRVLPLRVPRDSVADGLDAVAAACRAGLERSRTPGGVLAHAEGLACTGRDENELLRWLEVDSVHGVPLPPTLRWRAVQRLAELGLADPAFVAAEGRRDRTAEGELGAARALAARPTREAKESAWAAAATPDIGNRRFQAVMGGLWSLEQTGLLDPFVDRYLAAAPGWARRGQGFAQVVGQAFPALPLTQAQMAALVSALDGEVPTVLRRQWADRLDDLLMSAHIGGGRLL
jgi:aminopeptidase N